MAFGMRAWIGVLSVAVNTLPRLRFRRGLVFGSRGTAPLFSKDVMTSVTGVLFDKRCDGGLRTVIGLVCLLSTRRVPGPGTGPGPGPGPGPTNIATCGAQQGQGFFQCISLVQGYRSLRNVLDNAPSGWNLTLGALV